ncbi:MAG TPA: TonB-dependent receptor [Solimonas sp.]|nr:TonB-dependent receptor [Solimonas sp.]
MRFRHTPLALAAACLFVSAAQAQTEAADAPRQLDPVQVTATREAEPVTMIPAAITVVTGEQMRALGASDLRTALNLVAGVEISPGGDGGPAGSVPAMWGLREFDAFLLVVDGVPAGGAFNPALTTLDLNNIERIEVLRGAAPVMYGATSFVGVIHVRHYAAGQADRRLSATVGGPSGRFGSFSVNAATVLSDGDIKQSISGNVEKRNFKDERAGVERGHVLYRLGSGGFRLDADVVRLDQEPDSPVLRDAATVLTTRTPLDANHNPSDAKIDTTRVAISAGYVRDTALGAWDTTLALTNTRDDIVKGYLENAPLAADPVNAHGYAQERTITDLYFDTHLRSMPAASLGLTWGIDALLGKGEQESAVFPYTVNRDGSGAPSSGTARNCAPNPPTCESNESEDERQFLGAYVQADWSVTPRWTVLAGLRLNQTHEKQEGEDDSTSPPTQATDEETETRFSGGIGSSYKLWDGGEDHLVVYADYRNTFKPAAIDFGPEGEANILEPEEAHAYEGGFKGALLDGRLSYDLSVFTMKFENSVFAQQTAAGNPALANAGVLYFKGGEFESRFRLLADLSLYANYARHDLRFGDFVRTFGGTPRQLRGNYQELAPQNIGALGLIYAPSLGFNASAVYHYTGRRWLNQRNTVRAGDYETLDAAVGYRVGRFEISLRGNNLTDQRDAVSESELGDAQYFRMPARTVELGFSMDL